MKLEEANKLSLPEAIHYVMEKLVEQGKPCLTYDNELPGSTKTCMYGDGEGNHCGIGWLLDEDDKEMMEYQGCVDDLVSTFLPKLPDVIVQNQNVMSNLQQWHDMKNSECTHVNPALIHNFLSSVPGIKPETIKLMDRWRDEVKKC